MSSGEGIDAGTPRKRNYKLLVDPELDPTATKKIYRFNGVLSGVSVSRVREIPPQLNMSIDTSTISNSIEFGIMKIVPARN